MAIAFSAECKIETARSHRAWGTLLVGSLFLAGWFALAFGASEWTDTLTWHAGGAPWQFVSYPLAHAADLMGILNLALNLIIFFIVAAALERRAGTWRLLALLVIVTIVAAVFHMIFESDAPLAGAAPLLFGLFGALIIVHPYSMLRMGFGRNLRAGKSWRIHWSVLLIVFASLNFLLLYGARGMERAQLESLTLNLPAFLSGVLVAILVYGLHAFTMRAEKDRKDALTLETAESAGDEETKARLKQAAEARAQAKSVESLMNRLTQAVSHGNGLEALVIFRDVREQGHELTLAPGHQMDLARILLRNNAGAEGVAVLEKLVELYPEKTVARLARIELTKQIEAERKERNQNAAIAQQYIAQQPNLNLNREAQQLLSDVSDYLGGSSAQTPTPASLAETSPRSLVTLNVQAAAVSPGPTDIANPPTPTPISVTPTPTPVPVGTLASSEIDEFTPGEESTAGFLRRAGAEPDIDHDMSGSTPVAPPAAVPAQEVTSKIEKLIVVAKQEPPEKPQPRDPAMPREYPLTPEWRALLQNRFTFSSKSRYSLVASPDHPLNLKSILKTLAPRLGLTPEAAHHALICRRGLLAENLSKQEAGALAENLNALGQAVLLCEENLAPDYSANIDVIDFTVAPDLIRFQTMDGTCEAAPAAIWMLSAGQLILHPGAPPRTVIDIIVENPRVRLNLWENLLRLPARSTQTLAGKFYERVKELAAVADMALRTRTFKAWQEHSGAQTPEVFASQLEYDNFLRWHLLAYFTPQRLFAP